MHTIEQLLMFTKAGHTLASGHYQETIISPDRTVCNAQRDAILLRLTYRPVREYLPLQPGTERYKTIMRLHHGYLMLDSNSKDGGYWPVVGYSGR